MAVIACPACQKPMQVEESEASTEWECPSCEAAFLIQQNDDGSLEFFLTEEAPPRSDGQFSTRPLGASSLAARDPDIKDETYVYALECLLKGTRPRDVRKSLVKSGHSPKQANQIVQTALRFQRDNEAKEQASVGGGADAGQRNMIIGAIVFLIGIIVTFGSMSFATQAGGGSYVVAWGAVVFGAIQFFRGLAQSKSGG